MKAGRADAAREGRRTRRRVTPNPSRETHSQPTPRAAVRTGTHQKEARGHGGVPVRSTRHRKGEPPTRQCQEVVRKKAGRQVDVAPRGEKVGKKRKPETTNQQVPAKRKSGGDGGVEGRRPGTRDSEEV